MSSRLRWVGPAAVLFVAVIPSLCVAQTATTNRPSALFRSRTDLVAVDVSVESHTGEAVPPLTADQFLVFEDNVPQKVTIFSHEGRLPLAVALLVDHSQSMAGDRLERAKAAATRFLRALEPDDLVEILAFNGSSARLYPLGADHAAAEQSIDGISASGSTTLYDALLIGLRDLGHLRTQGWIDYRKAIVVLTDGEDTASHEAFEDVLEDARRSDVAVDAVSLRTDEHDRPLAPAHELAQLAFDTGGQAIAVRRLADLTTIYEAIAADLQHQYRLGYVSSSSSNDGRWRRISVRTTNADLVVRTRAGYYAARSAPGQSASSTDW